jgi:hypothetical protein
MLLSCYICDRLFIRAFCNYIKFPFWREINWFSFQSVRYTFSMLLRHLTSMVFVIKSMVVQQCSHLQSHCFFSRFTTCNYKCPCICRDDHWTLNVILFCNTMNKPAFSNTVILYWQKVNIKVFNEKNM